MRAHGLRTLTVAGTRTSRGLSIVVLYSFAMEKPRKGNGCCCIKSCKNGWKTSNTGIKFHFFSTARHKVEQRKLWINWVRKINCSADWEPQKYTRICSAHFVGNRACSMPLSPGYVPSIPGRNHMELSSHEKCVIQRFDRSMHRRSDIRLCEKTIRMRIDADGKAIEEVLEPSHHLDRPIEPTTQLLRIDQEVQVDPIGLAADDRNLYEGTKTFICTRYVNNDICHAQTQVFIPEHHQSSVIVTKMDITDEFWGPSSVQVDKEIGSDNRDYILGNLTVCPTGFHGISSITKDQEMLDLCAVALSTFQLLLNSLPENKPKEISRENQLLIFLMKLKSGMSFSAIAVLFRVDRPTASRIFFNVLQVMRIACSQFITWPCLDVIRSTMPEVFKNSYENTTVIIDCAEITVEQTNNVEERVNTDSHYNEGFAVKVLVGFIPCGLISFVSNCYEARTSDGQITVDCGILDSLQPHDVVLADERFSRIQTVLDENGKGSLIIMPPLLRNGQFEGENVEETYQIDEVRVHVEKIMERLRTYKILDYFSIDMLPHADSIVFVCAALVNLRPPIIKNDDVDENDLADAD